MLAIARRRGSNRHVAGTQRGIQPAGEPKAHDGRKFDLGQIKERRVQQADIGAAAKGDHARAAAKAGGLSRTRRRP